jgi:Zn-dependent peptidase ImmA (M78 family)/transcriptional regulator with XRE-family HTH domain
MTQELLQFGRRLAHLRANRQLSQERVAEALGIGRMALVQMEKGLQNPDTVQLAKMADLFGIQIADFFINTDAEERDSDPVSILGRISVLADHAEAHEAATRCVRLWQLGVWLEELLEREVRSGPPNYEYPMPRQFAEAAAQGQRAAEEERRRLQLGDVPVRAIPELLVSQLIWTSETKLPDCVSGLFLQHSSVGLAVLINSQHGHARKRFSLLHEYAHALLDRDLRFTLTARDNANDFRERRANSFAASFLMPRGGVETLLTRIQKGGRSRVHYNAYDVANDTGASAERRIKAGEQQINARDVVAVARHFGASFQAACYRLFELDHVGREQRDALLAQHGSVPELGRIFGLADEEQVEPNAGDTVKELLQEKREEGELISQLALLTAEAKQRGLISRGKVLDIATQLGISGRDLLRAACDETGSEGH